MEPSEHGSPTPSNGRENYSWPSINRPDNQAFESIRSLRNLTIVPGAGPVTPVEGSMVNLFSSPVSSIPRTGHVPLLPRPPHILKSQNSPKPCTVCGRRGCSLVSHKHFAAQLRTRRRDSQQDSPTIPKTTNRPSHWQLEPPDVVQYPIVMDPERRQLLALWSQEWGRNKHGPERHLFPLRWIEQVLPVATKHAPLLHALLATSASMWTMANASMHETALKNLNDADQALIHICANQATASHDECLLAALLLTVVHQAEGNSFEAERRFGSIERLVGLRGGPHYLGLSGTVAEVLLYADHVQTLLLDKEPVWRMPLPALTVGVLPRLGAGFRALGVMDLLDASLIAAADSLCRAADIFEQIPGSQLSSSGEIHSFGYLSMISEYQLSRCYIMFNSSDTLNECVCLALLLFNHVVLRNDGSITAITRKLEQRFWTTVDVAISRDFSRNIPPCMLLWMLTMALSPCVQTDCQHRWSAVRKMRAAKISAAVSGWDHFKLRVLDDFLWMRTAQESFVRELWLEVEEGRRSTGSVELRSN